MNNILFTYDLFLSSPFFFVQGLIPLDIENTPSVKTAVISSCPMPDRKSFTGFSSLPVVSSYPVPAEYASRRFQNGFRRFQITSNCELKCELNGELNRPPDLDCGVA